MRLLQVGASLSRVAVLDVDLTESFQGARVLKGTEGAGDGEGLSLTLAGLASFCGLGC